MNRVNPYYLHVALEPLCGMADDDVQVDHYRELDRSDESAYKSIIQSEILPHVALLGSQETSSMELALKFFLSKNDSNFGRVFDSVLPPFEPPLEPRDFFLWIWEECFSGSWQLEGLEDYEVVADPEEPASEVRPRPPQAD